MAKSKAKGSAFERKIATALRRIYDPKELSQQLGFLQRNRKFKEHRALLKQSAVRRSDQGKGAVEPDVVVRGCPCWIECEDAWDSRPLTKYRQALRDVTETRSPLWPTAICHRSGERDTTVLMSLVHLAKLADLTSKRINRESKAFDLAFPVRLEFGDWLALLADHHARGQK